MTVYFTSDLHLGHRLVAGLRGFDSPESHDAAIAAYWSERITDRDDVWVLGDLAASSPADALAILSTLPGRKHLVSGNHDRCHPMHRDSHNWLGRYLSVFHSVQPFARRKIAGENVLMSHFPYHRDRDEPRHTQYRLRNEGAWLLHGHTHGRERLTIDESRGTNEVHVGVDAWDLHPVSLDEVAGVMGL